MGDELTRFGTSVSTKLLDSFDALIASHGYASRSEAIRDMMRQYLIEHQIADPEAVVLGTLTLVYTHDHSDLMHKLTEIQHQAHQVIIAALHVHQDAHTCMEVLVLKGPSAQIQKIADQLISTKGVGHGKLVLTSG